MEPIYEPHASPVQLERLNRLFEAQQASYDANRYPDAEVRRTNLGKLEKVLLDNIDAIAQAISADFGSRSPNETRIELFASIEGIRHAKSHLKGWMKSRRAGVSMWFAPATGKVMPQPLGVVGIIVPWNYPAYLAIGPLTSALAAGNRAMIKMSEATPHTGELLGNLLRSQFDESLVCVINGGPDVAQAFSSKPFDHLLFTGSTAVGKHVMRAAADHLTPVTLELGGKSPTILSPDFPMETAVKRIMFGKCFNAGQTCVAPDYLLVPAGKEQAFIDLARQQVAKFFPKMATNNDFSAVVNPRHRQRLQGYLDDARAKGATLIELNPAGENLSATGKIAPTLVLNVNDDMKIMQEEIFGPLLPILPYRDLGEAIKYVNARPRPLALYYFDHDSRRIDRVMRETISGGVTLNDTIIHFPQDDLPTGGVGASGMGYYHGKYGFDTMSKLKGIISQSRFDTLWLMHPPYGRMFKTIYKLMTGRN
ncbi:coniferyl aldehyde dehydrogenase [Chitinivorax sp. PXF-14]|uniref:coniferyl aldehyde dehydrogenase n=1 Tax=Chitinivorax sp. PXF-14 TaxID=3230488 RepID=UPI003466B134